MASAEMARTAKTVEQAVQQIAQAMGTARTALEAVAEFDLMNELPVNDADLIANDGSQTKKRFLNNLQILATVAHKVNGVTHPQDPTKTALGNDPLAPDETTRLLWIGYR